MNIISAKYQVDYQGNNCAIETVIDGITYSVPLDPHNRHYAEILEQVKEGTLTIKEAE